MHKIFLLTRAPGGVVLAVIRPDFDLVSEALQLNTGKQPSAPTVQRILNLCRQADLDPVGVLERADKPLKNPVAWVQFACNARHDWIDSAGNQNAFRARLHYMQTQPITLNSTGPENLSQILERLKNLHQHVKQI